jgi:hypothetical protein
MKSLLLVCAGVLGLSQGAYAKACPDAHDVELVIVDVSPSHKKCSVVTREEWEMMQNADPGEPFPPKFAWEAIRCAPGETIGSSVPGWASYYDFPDPLGRSRCSRSLSRKK